MLETAHFRAFDVGRRVDARDYRGKWFAGAVVELADDKDDESKRLPATAPSSSSGKNSATTRVRVHFDKFAPKWDEW